jgi:hypothetical protein
MIVDDDASMGRAGAIWNHFKSIYSTRAPQREPSSRRAALRKGSRLPITKKRVAEPRAFRNLEKEAFVTR